MSTFPCNAFIFMYDILFALWSIWNNDGNASANVWFQIICVQADT